MKIESECGAWMVECEVNPLLGGAHSSETMSPALAGGAPCTKRQPVSQRVSTSVPDQGTCPGCGPGPQGGACERQPTDVCLPLRLPPLPSL